MLVDFVVNTMNQLLLEIGIGVEEFEMRSLFWGHLCSWWNIKSPRTVKKVSPSVKRTEKAGLLKKHASLFPEHFVHSIWFVRHHRVGRCSYEDSKSFLSKWNIFSQASFPQLFIIWTLWRCDGSVGKTTSSWSDVAVCMCVCASVNWGVWGRWRAC